LQKHAHQKYERRTQQSNSIEEVSVRESWKQFTDAKQEYDDNGADLYGTPDLARDSGNPSLPHNHIRPNGYPNYLASASGRRSYQNNFGDGRGSDPSSPHLEGQPDPMSYSVAPLLRSFAAPTKTHRRKRQSTHRNAASSGALKELGKIGLAAVASKNDTSLGSQFARSLDLSSEASVRASPPILNHQGDHSPSPSLPHDFHPEHHFATHKSTQSGHATPIIASYTPFSLTFNNKAKSSATNIVSESDEDMARDGWISVEEMMENAKRKLAEKRLREQEPMNGDPNVEQIRSLGKQQQHRDEEYHTAEHRETRRPVERAEIREQKKRQKMELETCKKADPAAAREAARRKKELFAQGTSTNPETKRG
jgi:hypothetical protein